MSNDVDLLRRNLLGGDGEADNRTAQQKVDDFCRAVLEEVPELIAPLLCCQQETDAERLRERLTALESHLLEIVNDLSVKVPGWEENLVYARQSLQEADYQIGWSNDRIYKRTACLTLRESVRRLLNEVCRLRDLSTEELGANAGKLSLGRLNVTSFKNCCTAASIEVDKATFLNRRTLMNPPIGSQVEPQSVNNERKLMDSLRVIASQNTPNDAGASTGSAANASKPESHETEQQTAYENGRMTRSEADPEGRGPEDSGSYTKITKVRHRQLLGTHKPMPTRTYQVKAKNRELGIHPDDIGSKGQSVRLSTVIYDELLEDEKRRKAESQT